MESLGEDGVGSKVAVAVGDGEAVAVADVEFPAFSRKQAVRMNSVMRRREDAFFMKCMDTFHCLIRKTVVAVSKQHIGFTHGAWHK